MFWEAIVRIQTALLSVYEKTSIVDFARSLTQDFGVGLLSTGGTERALREAGIEVRSVSDYTGHPEILDGRVKTLHPKIEGGILGERSKPAHVAQMERHGILPIDMVVCNHAAIDSYWTTRAPSKLAESL